MLLTFGCATNRNLYFDAEIVAIPHSPIYLLFLDVFLLESVDLQIGICCSRSVYTINIGNQVIIDGELFGGTKLRGQQTDNERKKKP